MSGTDPAEEDPVSEASVSIASQTALEPTPEDCGDPRELFRAKRQLQKDLKKIAKENLHMKDTIDAAKVNNTV